MARRSSHITRPTPFASGAARAPLVALMLASLQAVGLALSASPKLRSMFAVAPEAIFRNGELWRMVAGPLISADFSWPSAALSVIAAFVIGWHLEVSQGRGRTVLLFLGGSVFAAALWSIAALVWNWHRPLFSPVGTTALAVGMLLPGLRRPFPAFLPVHVPVWIAFVAYVTLWSGVAFAGAIDLSAHFLAGLFAVLAGQVRRREAAARTAARSDPVSPPPADVFPAPRPTQVAPDPAFDERVDALLQKITEAGYDSLSEDEIALLLEASQRYRDRPPPPR